MNTSCWKGHLDHLALPSAWYFFPPFSLSSIYPYAYGILLFSMYGNEAAHMSGMAFV
jgi:hypothetical protein